MCELDCEESWVPKNWSFWTVVLEKTLESRLDCKEIQPVHPKGDRSWVFIGRTDAEAETSILWLPDVKCWLIWKDHDAGRDWGQEEKGTTKDEMAGWHHQLDGHEFEWTPGVGDGQGGLACCNSWGRKESDMTERLNWTELMRGRSKKYVWSRVMRVKGFPGDSVVRNPPAIALDTGSISGWGRSPEGKQWQPTPVFLPGKSHGERSLVGCCTWGSEQGWIWLNN